MANQDYITIQGAREHNLKGVSVRIPKNKLVVFTGLSGSGKSSLAFDTLYAEGQRRYVESLSSYARQFLGIMKKPEVDNIEGLSPAISIDQKTTSHNPRSTVGTITEIYDYMRLLFARVGHPHCPNCGKEITTQSIDQIIQRIMNEVHSRANGQPVRFIIYSPVIRQKKGSFDSLFSNLVQKGYQKARIDKTIYSLEDDLTLIKTNKHDIDVVLDRVSISRQQLKDEDELRKTQSRITQSIEEALKLADGLALVSFITDANVNFPEQPQEYTDLFFSEKRACTDCGISIHEIEPRLFSFNSPQGACPTCNGLGTLLKISQDKIIASGLTVSEGAVIPFARMMGSDTWWARLVKTVVEQEGGDFRRDNWEDLPEKTKHVLLFGSEKIYEVEGENRFGRMTSIQEKFEGFVKNLERRYQETDSEFIRKDIEQYMERQVCPECQGDRLKAEALSVHVEGKNIAEITKLPISDTLLWSAALQQSDILTPKEKIISESILKEITSRLSFLESVGLNYLTLSREAATLAGGEAQRIRLASQIGTGLTGVLYILDEPTIGLHQRDNHRLIDTLKNLQQKGNTVVVVEHDRDVMLASDEILDFGPGAGKHGGEVVSQGTPAEIMADPNSLTGKYLSRKKDVLIDKKKTKSERSVVSIDGPDTNSSAAIKIIGAAHHNLKGIDVSFPLGKLICITGISGSGKSTLLHDTLYHHLERHLGKLFQDSPGKIERIMVPDEVKKVKLIDQSPIGKTPRSNPATYTKIFDYIRKAFTLTQDAQIRGFEAGRFSFNVKGGRCEACQGDGQVKIEMQFLPDVYVTCDVCNGARYNQETLEVRLNSKNIAEVLDMTVDEATEFFKNFSAISSKLKTLQQVGLGYVHLGQPAPTLSGGEAQRVKLARELSTSERTHTVFLLDEPTTGLHFHDIDKLLQVLHRLVKQNNTVIVIEHNLDVIKNADWLVDLGPEGGDQGGEVVAEGVPAVVAQNPQSWTGKYLKEELAAMKMTQ